MCTSPIHIKNRSLHFDEGMPLYFDVPCGHCLECQKAAQNEWFVRCYYEWKVKPNTTYFYTLTYNNENLPSYLGISCFSKRHIQLFLKRLRKSLSSYSVKLKYLVTSEFGKLYGRPHYHALFFLDYPLNSFLFNSLVKKAWQYGFVKPGDNLGRVTSFQGIKYVTKYITKDYSHVDNFFEHIASPLYLRYDSLLRYIQRRYGMYHQYTLCCDYESRRFYIRRFDGKPLTNDLDDVAFARKFISKVRSIYLSRMPFHLQSSKLGYDFALLVKSKLVADGCCFVLQSNMEYVPYALPRSFRRLFWFDCVENENDGKRTRFVLNEEGKQHYLSTLSKKVEVENSRLMQVTLSPQFIDDGCLKSVNDVLPRNHRFATIHDFSFFMRNLHVDFYILSIYSVVFRNRLIPRNCYDLELDSRLVNDNFISYADYCLTYSHQVDYGRIYELVEGIPKEQAFNLITWNVHPFFRLYEYLLKIFDAVLAYNASIASDAQLEHDKVVRNLRQLYKKL